MKRVISFLTCALIFFVPAVALAQDATAVCLAMVTDAAHNVGIETSSSSFLNTVYSNYCELDGSVNTSSFNAGLSAVVQEIPLNFTLGSTDSSSEIKNFCKTYSSQYAASSQNYDYNSIVVQKALDSANQCLTIATNYRTQISYVIQTPAILAIHFTIPGGQVLHIHGIYHEASVSCVGGKVSGDGVIDYGPGVGQTITSGAGTYSVSCTRSPYTTQNGTSLYNATALTVDTNMGSLDVFWPTDTNLPYTTASNIESSVATLNTQLQNLQTTVNFNLLPIGTLLPWFVQNQDPPKGWAKCDGSDPRCPNIMGRFLLAGNSGEVGSEGGGDPLQVPMVFMGSNGSHPDGNGWSLSDDHYAPAGGQTATVNNPPLPPYVKVLYIVKVSNS